MVWWNPFSYFKKRKAPKPKLQPESERSLFALASDDTSEGTFARGPNPTQGDSDEESEESEGQSDLQLETLVETCSPTSQKEVRSSPEPPAPPTSREEVEEARAEIAYGSAAGIVETESGGASPAGGMLSPSGDQSSGPWWNKFGLSPMKEKSEEAPAFNLQTSSETRSGGSEARTKEAEADFGHLVRMAESRRAKSDPPKSEGGDWEAPGSAPAPRFRSTACLVMPRPDDYFLKKSSNGPEAPTAPTSASLNDLIYLDPGHFREIAERGEARVQMPGKSRAKPDQAGESGVRADRKARFGNELNGEGEDAWKPQRILPPFLKRFVFTSRTPGLLWERCRSFNSIPAHSIPAGDVFRAAGTPLLTAEEEMQYQRALWVNRLLKEQLAAQTQGLSLKEIEEAQTQIQARMRQATRLQAWTSSQGPDPGSARTIYAKSPRRSQTQQARPQVVSSCEVNRRRAQHRIKEENLGILQRIENVKSSFTPRMPSNLIRKISPRNRLLNHGH
ncbi:unnamed protein product [Symbiodinium sp. CCMP2456]|nr:unnamed protein product [Symbiodinium sp. CCMP2456]